MEVWNIYQIKAKIEGILTLNLILILEKNSNDCFYPFYDRGQSGLFWTERMKQRHKQLYVNSLVSVYFVYVFE